MTIYVTPIVEGETERLCVKILLSRIWRELIAGDEFAPLAVLPPLVTKRSAFVKKTHPQIEESIGRSGEALQRVLRRCPTDKGFILILIDAEKDCPATLGPELMMRAKLVRGDMDIACVLVKRELENWFKAAAASLAGVGGLPIDLVASSDAEVGSGDAWLTAQKRRVDPKSVYKKPDDAVELAKAMDLAVCRVNSPSFDKLCRELADRVPAPPPVAPEPEVPG